jgi:hypothetical protein
VASDGAEPGGFRPGATTTNTPQRRVLFLKNAQQGQFYGTIGQLDDTGRANYGALLLSLQRRLKNNLSVLSKWTISKCMSDPATTEITGPTIVDPPIRTLTMRTARPTAGTSSACPWSRARRIWQRRRAPDPWRLAVFADRPLAIG